MSVVEERSQKRTTTVDLSPQDFRRTDEVNDPQMSGEGRP